jgi:hypothetical protein
MQFKLEQAVEILSQTPVTLRAMLGNLSEDWTHGGSREDWSPYDVVGHLIHCENVDWIPRAQVIIDQGDIRDFPPFDRFAQFENSRGKTLPELLDEFERLRGECLRTLKSMDLDAEKLALKGIHPEFGEVDLAQLLSTWAVHDLGHIRQIAAFMAAKYADAVGPWKAYLSILK